MLSELEQPLAAKPYKNPFRKLVASGQVPETSPAPVLRGRRWHPAGWWHPAAERRPHPGKQLSAAV